MTIAETTPAAAPQLDAGVRDPLDRAVASLREGTRSWPHLTLGQRAKLLERVRAATVAVAPEWADTAATSKDLEPEHPLRGEEWLGGPYAVLVALDALVSTLKALAGGASPLDGVAVDAAPGGRVRARVFPTTAVDALLLSGHTAEVWFEPGVTAAEARREAGLGQLRPTTPAEVGLVLGAGNVTSIPVLDVLYELLASNRLSILKLNPTQDALAPVFERALAPLIEPGYLRVVRGGGDVGAYLTQHPDVSHVHITGSIDTFNAIVRGDPAGVAETVEASPGDPSAHSRTDRTRREPMLRKPITAELGGVSPIIVVPGEWTQADLRYQAEHVATMRLQNSGHNCIAGQMVLVSADWPQRKAFLDALRTAYAAAPSRSVWYPRSDERLASVASAYPQAQWSADRTRAVVELSPGDDAGVLETTEFFAPVLGVATLRGSGQEFLDSAVAHANEKLVGTLGANVLIDPVTQAALGDGFERALAGLRYGAIAVNTWTAFNFLTPTATWGAFPGATVADAGSGIGVVHNALLLDRVERSVTRGPFRPFPRSIVPTVRRSAGGRPSINWSSPTVLPKPPWFVSSRTGAAVSEGFTRFRMDRNRVRMIRTLVAAYRA